MGRKTPATLRSHRWFGVDDLRAFGHRSRAKQQGFAREDWDGKPVIAIVNTWSDANPCHAHLRTRAEEVKRGVWQAGGFPLELPAISLGESLMKPTTMLYRNLLAMEEVLADIRPAVRRGQLVLSVAASVPTAFIEKRLTPGVAVVRAMPNTPCVVGHGMTVLSAGRHARAGHVEAARRIFAPLGLCLTLDEKHMDAVTALSASGPAYLYVVIESLAEGGVKVGLPREVATTLVAQMVLGSAAMVLRSGEHPATLKDAVTTPAGCTIDGLLALEEGGLRVALIRAVVRATRRAGELIHGGAPGREERRG